MLYIHADKSNGRFAIDRKFEYIYRVCLLSVWALCGPLGQVRRSYELLCKHVFHLYVSSAVEIKVLNMKTSMRVQRVGQFVFGNQRYMNFDVLFFQPTVPAGTILLVTPTDAPGTQIPKIPNTPDIQKIRHVRKGSHPGLLRRWVLHAPGARMTVVDTNSRKLYYISIVFTYILYIYLSIYIYVYVYIDICMHTGG